MSNALGRLQEFWRSEWQVRGGGERARCYRAVPCTEPKVFYGRDQIPSRDDAVTGGFVKVLDLHEAIPNTPQEAAILYLVSSALPSFAPGFAGLLLPSLAELMVRRARQCGARVVLNQNGVAYPGWYGRGFRRANRVNARLLRRADVVIYQSVFCRRTADRFAAEARGASVVLLNPVDTQRFRPGVRVAGAAPVLLLTGSHWAWYRVEAALETLARLRAGGLPARLVLAGALRWRATEAACLAEIEACRERLALGAAVEWRGGYTQTEAVPLMQSADILLHTKYNDPCPRVVAESLACGLPLVYSASGGLPELVGPDAGVGVPAPEDWERDHPPAPEALAAAVVRVWQAYDAYRAAARRRAEQALEVRPWVVAHRRIFEALARGDREGVPADLRGAEGRI